MAQTRTIRLLTQNTNDKGDLFTRLMKDLFYALGYDDLRLDVHKPGREIDIQGRHRHEPRLVKAECKAHKKKMGGTELNTFMGAMTRERKKHEIPVTGYFISLGGFTETGIDQEEETGTDRLILFDAQRIIKELESSRFLVDDVSAADQAGQCANRAGLQGASVHSIELLGHETGYVKAVYYSQNKHPTHFALIHADGTPLADVPAQAVINDDKASGGILHALYYLAPQPAAPDRKEMEAKVITHYRHWLGEECGHIQLDGLPTDADLGPRKLALERLFVPLNAVVSQPLNAETDEAELVVLPIGEMLTKAAHLALLAAPGGGKSTLLKRLATAYAFPERRFEIADELPDHDWLPLFLRCRELRERANLPLLTLLNDISDKAAMSPEEAEVFRVVIHERLQAGKILLLIDGLDEISDEAARVGFATNLRSFLVSFPQTALVVTSREAGFRLVAGVIASKCTNARLAPFGEEDVRHLCEQWHAEVVKDTPQVRKEALQLAEDIWENERIRVLAENPLLLTTLLVVKRWIGELPRNRAALYKAAVQVLVRTWNVEGFEPLDEEETLAQLSYVACSMMEQGVQQITHQALLKLLKEARDTMEAELRFTKISPSDFIARVEYRSSLLMQTGRALVDGELQEVYEFRHLTFQEFLAARGYAQEQHPRRNDEPTLVTLLTPHFEDERWREVIPLAAVLANRKAESIVKELIARSPQVFHRRNRERPSGFSCIILLTQCILDEVIISTNTLDEALKKIAVSLRVFRHQDGKNIAKLRRSKFGERFTSLALERFSTGTTDWEDYLTAAAGADISFENPPYSSESMPSFIDSLITALGGDKVQRIQAALDFMMCAFYWATNRDNNRPQRHNQDLQVKLSLGQVELLRRCFDEMLAVDDLPSQLVACWALAWGGQELLASVRPRPETLNRMFCIWYSATPYNNETARFAAWAISDQPLLLRDALNSEEMSSPIYDDFLREKIELRKSETQNEFAAIAAITCAWYRRSPWNDTKLTDLITDVYNLLDERSTVVRSERRLRQPLSLLKTLGKAGENVIKQRAEMIKREAKKLKDKDEKLGQED